MHEARLVLDVEPEDREAATAYVLRVPAVLTAATVQPDEVVADVLAPYEGQLAAVLELVRGAPGLRGLRVVVGAPPD
ncbi:MAG: hypothetical protein M3P31_04350 [Actinomycetota bacterium]|nr:hypothetical protein [Actinomycetota bacterium]